MQQVDLIADNRTEFLIKAVQDALEREQLSSGATMRQPYLQEYIEHLKKEAEDWKCAALRVSGLPRDCSLQDPPQLADEVMSELPELLPVSELSVEELHSEIDSTLRSLEEKQRLAHD